LVRSPTKNPAGAARRHPQLESRGTSYVPHDRISKNILRDRAKKLIKSPKLNLVTTSGKLGKEWEIRKLPMKRSHVKGLNMLTSLAWIDCPKFPVGNVELPLIDRWGKYTGENLYSSTLQPQQYISTVISTTFRRLKFWILSKKTNKIHHFNKRQGLLLRAASLVAMTKNYYLMDRILFLTKDLDKNWKTVQSLVHKFAKRVDDNTWFVYGHVCFQTQWLTSRALRPRDKSTINNAPVSKDPRFPRIPVNKTNSYNCIWNVFLKMSQISVAIHT